MASTDETAERPDFSASSALIVVMQRITSRQNPIVARYRDSARGRPSGSLLLDGAHLVSEALAAGVAIRHVAVSSDALDRDDIRTIVDTISGRGIEVAAASTAVMQAISPVRSSSPIVAIGERPAADAARIYADNALVVITADVQDPGNVGAIVRVAEAGGASGLVAAGSTANPFGWKALRGSMGSALRLPVALDPAADHAAADARRHGCRLVAMVARGGEPHGEADLRGRIAILVGGEGPGIAPSLVDTADVRVTIPMERPVESLNAAVAAAVLIYEARRQRMMGGAAGAGG
jgi:RNA methyltransferase, TrmH family